MKIKLFVLMLSFSSAAFGMHGKRVKKTPSQSVKRQARALAPSSDASISSLSNKSNNAWIDDLRKGNIADIAEALYDRKLCPNACNSSQESLLDIASSYGYAWLVSLLISMNAHVNRTDAMGTTPLLHAIEMGHNDVVGILLAADADPNIFLPTSYSTPLVRAVSLSNVKAVSLLLEKKASPNCSDCNGQTPLQQAIALQNVAIATLLLAAGADPNAEDATHKTPLLQAVTHANEDLVGVLLKAGADPTKNAALTSTSGTDTPYRIARKKNLPHIALKLLKSGAHASCTDEDFFANIHYMHIIGQKLWREEQAKFHQLFEESYMSLDQQRQTTLHDSFILSFTLKKHQVAGKYYASLKHLMKEHTSVKEDFRDSIIQILIYAVACADNQALRMMLELLAPVANNVHDDYLLASLLAIACMRLADSTSEHRKFIVETLLNAGAPLTKAFAYIHDSHRKKFHDNREILLKKYISSEHIEYLAYLKSTPSDSILSYLPQDLLKILSSYVVTPL